MLEKTEKLEREAVDMYRIMIVEDDFTMAKVMKQQIESWGHNSHVVENFQDVMGEFVRFNPHMVLLDITLPFFNGYHWCSEIRKSSNIPIVFLSSTADNMNIVMAMNMGGDDFIAKPVDLQVMMAKIQAMLRRTYDMGTAPNLLEHKGIVLNLSDASATYKGERAELTKNEFRILQTLMESRGKVVSRDTLMTKLWQMDCYVEDNTLTVNVNRLRKKLEQMGLFEFIKTKVGLGYIIE